MVPHVSPREGRPASRTAVALAVGGAVYAAALAFASGQPSPSLWGLNLPAFLPAPQRFLVLGCAFLGAGLLAWSAIRGAPSAAPSASSPRAKKGRGGSRVPTWVTVLPLYALPLLAAIFWTLRARTHFLGDGIVWIANVTSGQFPSFSEPLSSEIWRGYAGVLRGLGIPPDVSSLAALPVICGLAAAALLWLLAREIATGARGRIAAALLLLTLGVSQLYFGYIESYPLTSALILAYLLVGVRAAKAARLDAWPGVALALVAAAHIVSLALVPSYVWLVARARAPWLRKAVLLLLPAVLAAGLFAWLRFGVEDLLRPFRTMGEALRGGEGAFGFSLGGIVSPRRWVDLANLVLLLLPAPLILLAARAVSAARAGVAAWGFLLLAALPGAFATLVLVVPSSPAQDWDLLAIVLLPAALAVTAAGIPALERVSPRATAGILLIATAGLLGFVLVNADAAAGIRRFESLVGEEAALRPHERASGNEKLATYGSDRADFGRAFTHARRAVDAEPSNPRYWVKAGGALVSLDHHAEAVPYFQEALRRQPGRGDASYNLGICLAKEGRSHEAVAAFRTAVAADGDRPDYRHNLGLMLYAAGKPDSARLVWSEVLRRWEGYPLTVRSMERRFGAGVER